MVIGAHIGGDEAEESLLLFALKKAAVLQPQHKFILFTNLVIKDLPHNFLQVNIIPKPKNKLLLFYWYKYKLQKLFIKYNITSFISNAGMLAIDSTVHQYLFVEHQNFFIQQKSFFKNHLNNAIATAKTVFVTDGLLANEFNKNFKAFDNKILLFNFDLTKKNKQYSFEEIEALKEKYTEGFDYYLYDINTTSKFFVLTVLKAFSQLKKWQKTSLKLVLLFENDIDEKLLPDFKNYKYKNEVVIIKQTTENKLSLKAASFAYIFLGDYNYKQHVYDAMSYNVPVIVADTNENRFLFHLSVVYASLTVEGLALQLQNIYKDELSRKKQLQNANQFLANFDNQINTQKLIDIISNY